MNLLIAFARVHGSKSNWQSGDQNVLKTVCRDHSEQPIELEQCRTNTRCPLIVSRYSHMHGKLPTGSVMRETRGRATSNPRTTSTKPTTDSRALRSPREAQPNKANQHRFDEKSPRLGTRSPTHQHPQTLRWFLALMSAEGGKPSGGTPVRVTRRSGGYAASGHAQSGLPENCGKHLCTPGSISSRPLGRHAQQAECRTNTLVSAHTRNTVPWNCGLPRSLKQTQEAEE